MKNKLSPQDAAELMLISARIRRSALEMVYNATSGHLGGSFSICELLAVLYFHEMHIDPASPADPDRDRFVLSKGHCTPALYSALAFRGYFPLEELKSFRRLDGHMSDSPCCPVFRPGPCPPRPRCPGQGFRWTYPRL